MLYISGIHALNLPCKLDTCGDWHKSAIQWEQLTIRDSNLSIFKNYGIEANKKIPKHNGFYNVANHIRALLDLIEEGRFSIATGMNKDFICNDAYSNEIFSKVIYFKNKPNWSKINDFMKREYRSDWLDYINYHLL